MPWPPLNSPYCRCSGEPKCWVTRSKTGRDLIWVKAWCGSQYCTCKVLNQTLPPGRASSSEVHPASDSNPFKSCDYLLHTFWPFRTLLPCRIYETPNRQCFIRLGLGSLPLSLPFYPAVSGSRIQLSQCKELQSASCAMVTIFFPATCSSQMQGNIFT